MKPLTPTARYLWLLPAFVFTILVILGATMHPLWGDEAETALFARNILKYGLPRGWDGVNIMGINNAVTLDKNLLNHTSPWAQYYLVAASFALLGESSFMARLPSIVLSIVTFPLVFKLALLLSQRRSVATLAVWIMALSVPYILFAYQVRYYSLQTLAAILVAISCLHLPTSIHRYKILFILAGALLFYANYVSFIAFWLASLLTFSVYFYLKQPKVGVKQFIGWYLALSLGILALTLPWYLILRPTAGRGELVLYSLSDSLYGLGVFLRAALYPYNDNNAFPILFLPIFLLMLITKLRQNGEYLGFLLPLLLALIYLTIKAVVTLVAIVDTTFVHVRYTMLIFPFLVITSSSVIDGLWRWKRVVGMVVLSLYLATNIFTLNKFHLYPLEFWGEIILPYPTPDKVVADYLKIHAQDGDTAFVNLDRDHEPLIFHLKDKIRFVNRVSLVNTRIFPENRQLIPRYIYDFRDSPDWVILFSKRLPDPQDFLTFDARPLPPEINLARDYEEIALPVFFADMSRPEMELRSFTKINPNETDKVFIYKKRQL